MKEKIIRLVVLSCIIFCVTLLIHMTRSESNKALNEWEPIELFAEKPMNWPLWDAYNRAECRRVRLEYERRTNASR
jgi:hypothetical protein